MAFTVDHFVLTTGSGETEMKVTMNRYRPSTRQRSKGDAGFIPLFAHGTGFLKEIWEPTIEHLFTCDQANQDATRVLEVWSLDCQNHGEAAALNDELFLREPKILNIHHYAQAFVTLYHSGLLGDIKKGKQKIALVGHSAGAIASVFATAGFGSPRGAPFDMVILIDPPLFAPEMVDNMTDVYKMVEKTTPLRRAVWKSKDEAYKWLKARLPYKSWAPRVLRLYTEYGLRPLPTPLHAEKEGVVLICSPAHEAAAFSGTPDTLKAIDHLGKIMPIIPFHAIYGERNDMFSREVQNSLHDPSSGRTLASTRRVKGAGHLVPQERPDRLAEALKEVLSTGKSRKWTDKSKL
ncbi:alpha/beta-hydrolase [Agrocybe pediades]|nr:alpha/beta-hydrolase [Agrocybe pediades]